MVVQHNLRAMNSNRMLGLTTSVQAKSTEKLSSGYKINRAADDAAGLSISEKMRKQIRGLSQASLNAQDGISAVQTAEGALNEVQDMLQRMNELAVKAANGTMSEDDRGYIQDEIDQLTTEINRVANTTKFNETYLLKGDSDVAGEYAFSYKAPEVTFASSVTALYTADGTALDEEKAAEYLQANTGATLYQTAAGAGKAAVAGTDYEVTAAQAASGITAGVTLYVEGVSTAIAAGADASTLAGTSDSFATGVTVYKDSTLSSITAGAGATQATAAAAVTFFRESDGKIFTIAAGDALVDPDATGTALTDNNSTPIITSGYKVVTTATAADLNDTSGTWATAATAALRAGTTVYQADGTTITSDSALATYLATTGNVVYTVAPAATAGATEYTYSAPAGGEAAFYDKEGNWIAENALANYFETTDGTTITQKADTKLYDKDGNELTLSATDIANTLGTPEALTGDLNLTLHVGADATADNKISLDLQAMSADVLGLDNLKVDGADDKNALKAIETIKEALQRVSTQRSALGAVQNRLEHTIANLDNVVENTTAAESQIRDTDMATEMVKYSNNNILAQAGQAMLAQANQANQGVLSLLG